MADSFLLEEVLTADSLSVIQFFRVGNNKPRFHKVSLVTALTYTVMHPQHKAGLEPGFHRLSLLMHAL